jgi:hypothetical protein
VAVALIPVVSSNETTLHNRGYRTYRKAQYTYMTYITTYPPSGAHEFNVVWTALHTLQECIHILRKRPQDIPMSPHVLGARS